MIAGPYSRFLLALLLLFSFPVFSQDLEPPSGNLPVTIGLERDPQKLVARLTAGKDTDKEKFDAIFTWVAQNIHYDYATYLSPRGATMPQLKRILKTKSGICIDYAYLMDTLCTLAAIQNVSVYGYVKDDLFDVNDSLYIDNHGWNAVKLDNFWYVYDVTWSAGKYHLQFRRFGKWLLKVYKKLNKPKLITRTFRNRRASCKADSKFTVSYKTLPLWRYYLMKLISRLPVRVHWVMDKKTNANYYLANPEVFAVTHMPDDPRWSLTADYPGIRAFEVDPKYYHLEDTLYERQVRTGRHCGDCDSWFALDDLQKQKQFKHESWDFNPRNHIASFNADYNIANIFFKRSLPLEDSTDKIQHLDSALAYYTTAKDDLRKTNRDINMEYRELRAKNANKMKLLQKENRDHQSFIHAVYATTNKSTGAMKKFIARTRVTELRLENAQDKLSDLYVRTVPYNNKDNLIKMQEQFVKKKGIVDSVSDFIGVARVQYSAMLEALAKNMFAKDSVQDSLNVLFTRCGFQREFFLQDNYRKKVAEERKKIPPMKALYATDLQNSIYLLSDSVADLGLAIFHAFDKRDQYVLESGRLLNVLVNEGLLDKDSLKRHMDYYDQILEENICWLTTRSSQLDAVKKGYKRMLKRQKGLEDLIRWENRVEYGRYRYVNGDITWRKRKYASVPANNMKVCTREKGIVSMAKKEFLKKCKAERRKEREASRKRKKGI